MIWFNVPEAREFLLQHGDVYTLRPKLRREGKDVLAYGGFGAKGRVIVDLVQVVNSGAELKLFVSRSGFPNVDAWLSKVKEKYGIESEEWLAAGRPLYKVRLLNAEIIDRRYHPEPTRYRQGTVNSSAPGPALRVQTSSQVLKS